MQYQRFISYLYQYVNREKMKNTGYVKIEQKGAVVRFSLRTKVYEQDGNIYQIYLLHRNPDDMRVTGELVDRIKGKDSILTYQYITRSGQVYGMPSALDQFAGLLIQGETAGVYMTIWQDITVYPQDIVFDEQEAACSSEEGSEEDTTFFQAQDMFDEEEADAGVGDAKEAPELDVAKLLQNAEQFLFETKDKLPLIEGSELYDCVRIVPQDIGILPMKNWKYGQNSFLNHGYMHYRYLLLGKLRFQDDAERLMLGIPGIYDSREKRLADMFGFEQFISVKRTDKKEGEFGYWVVELAS